jgi:hypothetical protein
MLREEIIRRMPAELTGRIDVYVFDVSREKVAKRNKGTVKVAKPRKTSRANSVASAKPRTKVAKNAKSGAPAGRLKKGISKVASNTAAKKGAGTGGKRIKKASVGRSKTSGDPGKRSRSNKRVRREG